MMPSPRLVFKLFMAGACLASAGYSLYQLRGLAAMKQALSAPGASPEEALAKLAKDDKTGVVRGLVEAQVSQAQRLGALVDGEEAPTAAPQPGGHAQPQPQAVAPPSASDARGQRLFTAKARVETARNGASAAPGTAVLIDHKTGERLVVRRRADGALERGQRSLAAKVQALPHPLHGVFSDGLEARRNRAYALLLGTVAAAVALVFLARRYR